MCVDCTGGGLDKGILATVPLALALMLYNSVPPRMTLALPTLLTLRKSLG